MRYLAPLNSILALALFLAPCCLAAKSRARITIGFNPAEKTNLVEANGQRLSDYVKKKIGVEVSTFVAKDYEALVTALRSGKVDFAFLPPFSFIKAEESGKLLLKAVRKGQAVYYGAIIVREDSGIDRLEDLKGKSIAWVDRNSATGFLLPKAEMIRRKKIDPDTFFSKQIFTGTHDALVMAVFDGSVDAGATWVNDSDGKDGAWQLYLRKPADLKQVKMIFLTEPIPGDALTTSKKLWKEDRPLVEKVAKVLQRMGEALDGRQILGDLYGIDKMVPATPEDFAAVRAAAKIVNVQQTSH